MVMRESRNLIPDRSGPGITTAVTSGCEPRVTGGHATWAQRRVQRRTRRGGRQWRRKTARNEERKKVREAEVKVGTLNVGTMTGKGMEIVDMMGRRNVNILCVQETRWKGEKARNIGNGYKMWYYGTDNKRNGVGIILEKDLVDRVVEVWRISDRLMCLKLEKDGTMLNIISAYAPQVGCTREEKEAFWQELEETMEKVPREERVVIGADLNGHVGEGNHGDEDIMGTYC